MKRVVILALLLSGCTKAQETILAQANSSDAWHVVAATRHGKLQKGVNDIVIAVQDPMHAWINPGDAQVALVMKADHPRPSSSPPPVEMQPDGEPGHWLAIVELPQSGTWHCELNIDSKAVNHKVAFDLQN